MSIGSDHAQRVRVGTFKRGSMATLAAWIEENTTIAGAKFSFLNHEFQKTIASDTSQEVNVKKPSQVGLSELSARLALAMTKVVRGSTAIYTLPTATFASTFMKTRIDPVIRGSEALRNSVHKSNDNNEVKQIDDSFLYLRGAASSNAAISIPADFIINDELDFCDQEIVSQYASRVTHSSWKLFRRFSTPTIPGYGIDKAFIESRRFHNLCKCNHCATWFKPDYYEHVKIPGYTDDIRSLTNSSTLYRTRWREAHLACPKCGKEPSLQPEHRNYVLENTDDDFVPAAYQVTPFDAPNIIKVSDILQARLRYEREQDFVNFVLGLAMEDKDSTLMRSDLRFRHDLPSAPTRVMGIDVGHTYHAWIAEVTHAGVYLIHREQIPMGSIRTRYFELKRQYNVALSVIDSQPHAETVMYLQALDPNLYASVYVNSKDVLTHEVKERDEEKDEGKNFVRQVNVNRSRAFDAYMNDMREGTISFRASDDDETVIAHHTSMKRVRVWDDKTQNLVHSWVKTDGVDHYHHAGLYAWVAAKILGVASPLIMLPIFGAHSFRVRVKQ